MKNYKVTHASLAIPVVVFISLILFQGCDPLHFWQGDEQVTVRMDAESVTVPLKGLPLYSFQDKNAVNLSEIIKKAALLENPEDYFYNFIAADGYSLKALLINEKRETGLPPWEDMHKGYLYESASYELMVGWEKDTIGGLYGGCYKVKYMDGGTIEILEDDIEVQ